MKMAVFYSKDKIAYEDGPKPRPGKGEMVVRLASVGLCGTDIHKVLHETVPPGSVLGHEISAVVDEIGEGVTEFKVGDRVYGGHHVPCFTCDHCVHGHHSFCSQFKNTNFDPGGFAEYFRLSPLHVKHNFKKIPDGVSFDQAAMVEPLATIVHGMKRLSVMAGDSVLVMGAGPIGNMWAQALRYMGAGKVYVSDISEYRLKMAKQLGATAVINSKTESVKDAIKDLTKGRGPDVVVIAAGVSPLLKDAIELVAPGGQILVFTQLSENQPIDASRFFNGEVNIIGAYSSVPTEFGTAMALIERGAVRVEEMITHRFGLSRLAEAIKLATDPTADALKIMLHPEK